MLGGETGMFISSSIMIEALTGTVGQAVAMLAEVLRLLSDEACTERDEEMEMGRPAIPWRKAVVDTGATWGGIDGNWQAC